MQAKQTLQAICALLAGGMAAPAGAISLGQVDDFEDTTPMGWSAGQPLTNAPANVLGGIDGRSLRISTNGFFGGSGSRLLGLNRARWTGDYLAAGVDGITLQLQHPNNLGLNIRLALTGPGGNFVTPDIVVPPGSSTIHELAYSLKPEDLIPIEIVGSDASATLAEVTELRIIHNPDIDIRGTVFPGNGQAFVASFDVDNITAVPEPASAALLFAGSMLACRRRRVYA